MLYIDYPVPSPAHHKPVSAKVLATVVEQHSTPVCKSSPESFCHAQSSSRIIIIESSKRI